MTLPVLELQPVASRYTDCIIQAPGITHNTTICLLYQAVHPRFYKRELVNRVTTVQAVHLEWRMCNCILSHGNTIIALRLV
jgi:hypothetical protein